MTVMVDIACGYLMPNELALLRKRRGLSQQELADVLGVSRGTISRWENAKYSPDVSRLDDLADALDTDVQTLRKAMEVEDKEPPRHYVESEDDVSDWRDVVVVDRDIDDFTRVVLMSLPVFMDRKSWVVTVTVDEYIERTGRSREMVEEHLPKAMASQYVERIGKVEYTARLKFP